MSRQSLLPCAWLSVAFGLAIVVAPVPGWTQDRSTQERLDRLERDLNIRVPDDQLVGIQTVGQLLNLVAVKMPQAG